jgi:uncharacterized membrane protein YgdD (TMEM256/DUF423 family)
MRLPARFWLLVGAILGGLAVMAGAFGAHGLERLGLTDRQLANWETAARYQMYHALALAAVGLFAARRTSRSLHIAGGAMTVGTMIFSGCLYAVVLTGQPWLGAIVPIGGVLMVVGWVMLAFSAVVDGSSAKGDAP